MPILYNIFIITIIMNAFIERFRNKSFWIQQTFVSIQYMYIQMKSKKFCDIICIIRLTFNIYGKQYPNRNIHIISYSLYSIQEWERIYSRNSVLYSERDIIFIYIMIYLIYSPKTYNRFLLSVICLYSMQYLNKYF